MRISVTFRHFFIRNGVYCSKVVTSKKLRDFFSLVCPFPIDQQLVRIGAPNDGGYLIPDDLEGIGACFSPGVGQLTNFEEDLAHLGIHSFLADGSIDTPPLLTRCYISSKNTLVTKTLIPQFDSKIG